LCYQKATALHLLAATGATAERVRGPSMTWHRDQVVEDYSSRFRTLPKEQDEQIDFAAAAALVGV